MTIGKERLVVTAFVLLAIFSQWQAYSGSTMHPLEMTVDSHQQNLLRQSPAPYTYRILYPWLVEGIAHVLYD